VNAGPNIAGYVVFNGAYEDRTASSSVEQSFRQKGRGGFAIRAGDASRGELALGMAEVGCRSLGKRAAPVFHFQHRDTGLIDEQMIEGVRRVRDDPECTRCDGLIDVAIAVCRAALHGDENRARLHFARVVFNAGDRGIGACAGAHCGYFCY